MLATNSVVSRALAQPGMDLMSHTASNRSCQWKQQRRHRGGYRSSTHTAHSTQRTGRQAGSTEDVWCKAARRLGADRDTKVCARVWWWWWLQL